MSKNSFRYGSYLFNPSTKEEKEYIEGSFHFRFIRITMMRQSVLELDKLMTNSKNHHYSLAKMLLKIEKGEYGESVFEHEIITEYRRKLKSAKPLINKLKKVRDKVVAHTDIQTEYYRFDIDSETLHRLIKLGYEILDFMFLELNIEDIDKGSTQDREFDIVTKLINEEKR